MVSTTTIAIHSIARSACIALFKGNKKKLLACDWALPSRLWAHNSQVSILDCASDHHESRMSQSAKKKLEIIHTPIDQHVVSYVFMLTLCFWFYININEKEFLPSTHAMRLMIVHIYIIIKRD
jgi:hypothetical protein